MSLPIIQLLVSTCRSGSTAFANMMGNHPDVFVIHQPIKAGVRYYEGNKPDFSVFSQSSDSFHPAMKKNLKGKVFFVKETIGHTGADCEFPVFSNQAAVQRAK